MTAPRPMTLRTRLFLALLLLALAPTLVFAVFTFVQLHEATSRQYQSGVEDALEAAIETNRSTLARIEANALEHADQWAGSLAGIAADPAQRERMRGALRDAGLDFAQVYEREGEAWRLAATVTPAAGSAAEPPELSSWLGEALAGDRIVRSDDGVFAAVAPAGDGIVLATGVRFFPGFQERLERLRRVRQLYSRVGVLVSVQRQQVWLTVLALALVIAVGAAVLARMLASGMTRPLKQLTSALARVEDGETAERLPETGARELASLAASFNAMTARLTEARSALARAEREAAWRDFARKLAHELKNPLTPMTLSIHRLQRRLAHVPEADQRAVRDSLEALLYEVEHLHRLAESFAEHAKLPEPREEALDLSELARATAALHETSGVPLLVTCASPLPVRADRLLMSRALHNLILNACEASPAGGSVEVQSGGDAQEAWVEVRDRGTGLDPAVAARAFEPYVSTKQRGSGLGLALVRDVARQHGGRVTLENRDGGGAVARITLPRT